MHPGRVGAGDGRKSEYEVEKRSGSEPRAAAARISDVSASACFIFTSAKSDGSARREEDRHTRVRCPIRITTTSPINNKEQIAREPRESEIEATDRDLCSLEEFYLVSLSLQMRGERRRLARLHIAFINRTELQSSLALPT